MSLIYRIKTKVWITKPKKTKQKKATFNSSCFIQIWGENSEVLTWLYAP